MKDSEPASTLINTSKKLLVDMCGQSQYNLYYGKQH